MGVNDRRSSPTTNGNRSTVKRGRLTARHSPPPSESSFRQYTGSKIIMYFCIMICLVVCAAWHWSMGNLPSQSSSHRGQRSSSSLQMGTLDVLNKHFTLKLDDVKQARWWTLITPAFSHTDPDHLLGNLSAFHTFSKTLLKSEIGPASYGMLILGSAIAGHLGFLYQASRREPARRWWWWDILTRRTEIQALGLSGVVIGLGAVISLAAPKTKVVVFGAASLPIWQLLLLYIIYDSARLTDQTSTVGHAAHLGGAGFGAIFYVLWLRHRSVSPFIGRSRG